MQIGTQIIVHDHSSWYNGRKAVVKAIESYAGVTVCTVAVASPTGNAEITFALKPSEMEVV